MTFGFPARHAAVLRPPAGSHDLRDVVRQSLQALSWQVRFELVNAFIASTGPAPGPGAERIVVELLPDGGLEVTSRSAEWFHCFDRGRNEANVAAFAGELERRTRRPSPA